MCHVLIIEDDFLLALDLEGMLEAQGASSFSLAATEEEAVTAARSRRPDFISADGRLKQGTGPGAVATIRRELGPIPAIFVTGTPAECPTGELQTVIEKPFDPASIASAFRARALELD